MRKAGTEKARLNKGINDNCPQRCNNQIVGTPVLVIKKSQIGFKIYK